MNYIENFDKSRKNKIGSSDVPALIQHPEKPESLSGYGRTALTVYEEKTGISQREPAGLPAKIGHELECLILSEVISGIEGSETAEIFKRGYMLCELAKTKDGYKDAKAFQNTDYLHHTEAFNEHSVSHADCINVKKGILIEAKAVVIDWGAKRKESDPYSGYDSNLKHGQGIPLKHYMQIQHQAALYQSVYGIKLERLILAALIEGQIKTWEVKNDVKTQEKIFELCSVMKKCIDEKRQPKELAMNVNDVKSMYPIINEDFKIVSGEELERCIAYASVSKEASNQMKIWKERKEDADSALSLILKDSKQIKGIINGQMSTVATWTIRSGSERVESLKTIKEKDETIYKTLKEKGFVKNKDESKFISVKLKED